MLLVVVHLLLVGRGGAQELGEPKEKLKLEAQEAQKAQSEKSKAELEEHEEPGWGAKLLGASV